MPKGKLEFDLSSPEENASYRVCLNASNYRRALFDVRNYLKKLREGDLTEEQFKLSESIKRVFSDILKDNSIDEL